MLNAIREKVTVKAGGKIEIQSPELIEGTTAEVIVMVDNPPGKSRSLMSFFGVGRGKGGFKTAEEVDKFIRAERDAWKE